MNVSTSSRYIDAGNAVSSWLLLVVIWVGFTSALAIAMLAASMFRPLVAVSGAALLTVYIAWRWHLWPCLPGWRSFSAAGALALVALFFRLDVYPHVMGGQDQGLYTNMAALLERDGQLYYRDELRAALPADLRDIYDKTKMPGTSLVDPATSLKTIDFYPLHPAWMAIAKSVFGENRHTFSLFLFSALYLFAAFALVNRIFHSRLAGWFAAILLAVNPAMAFFSKYPVTETVALTFSLNAFLFLLVGAGESDRSRRILYLVASLLMFNAYFYTRMQFLMLLPFFVAAMVAVWLTLPAGPRRRDTLFAMAAVLGLFGLSIFFYVRLQPTLAVPMMEHFSSFVPGGRLLEASVLGGLAAFALLAIIRYSSQVRGAVINVLLMMLRAAPYLLALSFLAAVPSVFSFASDGRLSPFPFEIPLNEDPWVFRYHIAYRFMLMVSPIGAVMLLFMWWRNYDWPVLARVLMLFVASCWLLQLLQPAIPYLYYYGRYLVGEILPYSLLLVAGALAVLLGRVRWLGGLALISTIAYSLGFSIPQVGKIEGDDGRWFTEVKRTVGSGMVVLVDGDERVSTGLSIYQDLDVFPLSYDELSSMWLSGSWKKLVDVAMSQGRPVWVLARGSQLGPTSSTQKELPPFRNAFFDNGENLRNAGVYNPSTLMRMFLPYRNVEKVESYGLSQLADASDLDNICRREFSMKEPVLKPLVGLSGFGMPESHGTWTIGKRASFVCVLPAGGEYKRAIVQMTPYLPPGHKQQVVIRVNGARLFDQTYDSESVVEPIDIRLPDPDKHERYTIEFDMPDAISPQQAGQSADGRVLGVSVKSIRFLPLKDSTLDLCVGTMQFTRADWVSEDTLRGFDLPEPHGRWSLGEHAVLRCLLPERKPVERIELDISGFVAQGHVQNVRIMLNGKESMRVRLNEAQPSKRVELSVPHDASGELVVSFELPDAISPMELTGTADRRRIAISLSAVSFY